jgi:hypothetical protein
MVGRVQHANQFLAATGHAVMHIGQTLPVRRWRTTLPLTREGDLDFENSFLARAIAWYDIMAQNKAGC